MAKVNAEALRKALGKANAPVGVGQGDALRQAALGGQGYSHAGVAGATGGGGESAWSYIKKGGARALDALTVPQAALFTGVAKATGRDVDWGAALGNFSRNEEGEGGIERALSSLGVTNKWAQLGIGIVADPLWFTGVGVVRKAGAAKDAIKLATEGADTVSDARKAAMIRAFSPRAVRTPRQGAAVKSDAQQSALIRAFTGLSAEGGRNMTVAQRSAAMRAFSPTVRQPDRATALQRVADEIAAARDLSVGKSITVRLDQALGRTLRRKGVQYGHKAAVPFKPTRETATKWAVVSKRTAASKMATDAWGVPAAAEKVFATKDEALRFLAQAGRDAKLARGKVPTPKELREGLGQVTKPRVFTDAQKARLVKAFTAENKGVKLPKQVADQLPKALKSAKPLTIDKAKLGKALAAGRKRAAETPGVYDVDEFGRPLNIKGAVQDLRKRYETEVTRPAGSTIGIRLGLGKRSKTFSTGIKLPEKALRPKVMKGGYLALKPIEKIAHRLRDVGRETSEAVSSQMIMLAARHGMTETDALGRTAIKKDEASMLGVVRSARSLNTQMGERVEKWYRDRGLWEQRHSDMVHDLDQRYKTMEADLPGGQADRFQERISALKDEIAKINVQIENWQFKVEKFERKRDANKLSALMDQVAARERKIDMLKQRGPYTPQGKSFALREQQLKEFRQDVNLGLKRPGTEFSAKGPAHLEEREIADNPFATQSADDFVSDMVDAGMDEKVARNLSSVIDNELDRIGEPTMKAGSTRESGKGFAPEWNAMLLAGRREQTHIWKQVEDEIEDLLNESGILRDSDLWDSVMGTVRTDGRARLGNTKVGRGMMRAVAGLKGWFTFVNPAHFTTNFLGDFSNRQINGGFRHLLPFDAAPKSPFWHLGSATEYEGVVDAAALQRKWDIGGQEMTGMQLLMMSRMVGLGRGYVGTDVAIMVDAFEHAGRGPKEWYRWAQRMNIKRENAQRLGTWVRHMQAGDDPITAQIKTLRVHFDYTQLTDFEKLVVRNTLLFYTWLKRNTLLQGGGLVTRPGLYSAYADMENAREKIANEPGYYSEMGAIPTPFGSFAIASPVADLRHFELSWSNFRKTILGSVNPIGRVPVELATNQQMFTGGRLQDYEGEITPSVWASALSAAGVPLDVTSTKAGGERRPGLDPRLTHFLSQIAGPQLTTASSLTRPDYEGSAISEALGRFVGVKPLAERPVAFKRAQDYIDRKKKADETRRRNAQRER